MTDQERQRAIDFILAHQANSSGQLEKLIEAHRMAENRLTLSEERQGRSEFRLDRYERLLKLMIRAGRRERKNRNEADERLTNALTELAEAHKETERSIAHTDSKVDTLVDRMRLRMNGA